MKKIRFKFIFISAIAIFIVLFGIILGLNIVNSSNISKKNNETIQFIHNIYNSNSPNVPFPNLPESDDPEAKFRNRFFIANFEKDQLINIDVSYVARINEQEASKIAYKAYGTGNTDGVIDVYQYSAVKNGDLVKYVFLDIQDQNNQKNQVILVSSLVAAIGYAVVLVLIIVFSKIVIKPIEIADEKQKRFITDASHELKTPLTVINSNLEIIEMENGESEWISSSKKQIDNLTSMTNQLVMLSKLNEYNVKTTFKDVDIKSIIDNSAMSYIPLLQKKGVNLDLICNDEIIVKTDSIVFGQICNILLDNMLKYALEGQAYIKVEKARNNVAVSFINKYDTNSNVDVSSLFDRFYRADSSRNDTTKGFGIGLSLAKSLCELAKIKISASVLNGNITFKLVI